MKSLPISGLVALALMCSCVGTSSQKKTILIDVAHGQKFYSDPADKISSDLVPTERLRYMTGELTKNGAAHNAELAYLKTPITAEALSKGDLLFIHVPTAKYSAVECKAILEYVEKGGALFIVMEEDYWSTLAQANVNDIVSPFGITFSSNSTDKSSGGHSLPGRVARKKYSIPFHGARQVAGGTSFARSNASAGTPFAVFTALEGGGRVIAMGEGMASLYMTSWQGVDNYECAEFMGDMIGWLLE